jgi:hypothetical protein
MQLYPLVVPVVWTRFIFVWWILLAFFYLSVNPLGESADGLQCFLSENSSKTRFIFGSLFKKNVLLLLFNRIGHKRVSHNCFKNDFGKLPSDTHWHLHMLSLDDSRVSQFHNEFFKVSFNSKLQITLNFINKKVNFKMQSPTN